VEVIVDLLADRNVALAKRLDAVRPGNGSRVDIRYVLTKAAANFDELAALWEKHHG
jgi:hypothetical protein